MPELALVGGTAVRSEPIAGIPWPPVSDACAEKLAEVYRSREWSFSDPHQAQFAADFAEYHGARHCLFMANGTVTLQCALAACGVGPGDEVIVPGLTWMATAMAARYLGAKPVFADIEPSTLCLDPDAAADAITDRTRAIIPVHLYGSMADLERLGRVAEQHGLAMIEDCAHMQGGKWDGRGVGSWGDVGSFSFQQSKTLASGEGGACITNDDDLAERIFRLKHIGYAPAEEQGRPAGFPPPGLVCHNFRATAFQAVILSDQLKQLSSLIERYDANAARLRQRLDPMPGVRLQARGRKADPQGYYCLAFIFDEPPLSDIPIEAIQAALKAEGLSMGRTYGVVYHHRLFNLPPEDYRVHGGRCPAAEDVAEGRTLCLAHRMLGLDAETMDVMGEIVAKVVSHADELRGWTPPEEG